KISTFASQAHTEGRQGAFRWLLAGRRTYIDQVLEALRGAGLTDLELPYAFYDVQGSAHYDLGGGDGLMVSLYQGRDKLEFYPLELEWGNTILPVNYTGKLSSDLTTRATAAYSLFSQSFGLSSIFGIYNRIATWNYRQSFEYTGLADHRLSLGVDLNWMQTIFTSTQTVVDLKQRDYTSFWLNN